MSLGTLSESRIAVVPNTTTGTTAGATPSTTPIVTVPKPDKNTPAVITTTTITAPSDDGLVPKPTTEPAVVPAPTVTLTPTKKPCGYCMAKRVTSLAFQISAVLLVLALSFHLVKKV